MNPAPRAPLPPDVPEDDLPEPKQDANGRPQGETRARRAPRREAGSPLREAGSPLREAGASEDVDWLAAYRDGDRDAFSELVRAFEGRLVQFFYRLCWDRSRAEDLTQNLFLKLVRASERYRPEGKLATYVFRAATNLWIDHYRATRAERQFASLDQVLLSAGGDGAANGQLLHHGETGRRPDEDPVASAERREESEHLRQAVERLTTPHRLVFELAVLQQLPYAQVGEILDVPVGTVKSRMHNTVKALRELLAPAEQDAGFRGGVVGGGAALGPTQGMGARRMGARRMGGRAG